jgi:uncharacterized protein (DUF2062 family)
VWPHTGWRRAFVYYVRRLTRLSGTPHNIAAGFACGLAISFTPLVGFHLLLGGLLALIVRGNLLAMVVGTLVGNPWTLPFMWLGGYEVGKLLLGADSLGVAPLSAFQDLIGQLAETAKEAGPLVMLKRLAADLRVIGTPVLVGSIPLGLAAGLLTYVPLVRVIAAYQEARRRRREQRRSRTETDVQLKAAGAPSDAGTA